MQRIIDMSHTLIPGKSGRKLNLEMVGAEEVNPNVVRLENQWYIMHNITVEIPASETHVNHHALFGCHVPFQKFIQSKSICRIVREKLTEFS